MMQFSSRALLYASIGLVNMALLSACGGAPKKTDSTTPNSTAEPAPAAGATPAGLPECEMVENDENSNVVFSQKNDWFLTVSKDSNVDCNNQKGFADIEMAGIHINVVTQPLSQEGALEQDIQLVMKGYIEGISQSVTFDAPLSFTQKNIGEHGRKAYISDGRYELEGKGFHLLTSITATVNNNNQGIFHMVFWRVEETDFQQNQAMAMETIETISYSWFRLSDTDDEGNFITQW